MNKCFCYSFRFRAIDNFPCNLREFRKPWTEELGLVLVSLPITVAQSPQTITIDMAPLGHRNQVWVIACFIAEVSYDGDFQASGDKTRVGLYKDIIQDCLAQMFFFSQIQ